MYATKQTSAFAAQFSFHSPSVDASLNVFGSHNSSGPSWFNDDRLSDMVITTSCHNNRICVA
eukprot:8155032-Pyramimonas_sp.AAC.1